MPPRFWRISAKNARLAAWLRLAIAFLGVLSAAFAEDMLDPAFAKIPFDSWLADRDQARFQWSAHTSGGELGDLQRLRARVEITVDGNEVARRQGHGELVFFVQFSDGDHRRYQSHGSIALDEANEAAAKSNFVFTQNALAVPGDYRIAIGILDTKTGEHAALERTLHIAPPKNDPLPESWQGMPAIEFTQGGDPPDAWFQPQLTGHMHLPVATRRDMRVQLLVNASPSALGLKYRTGQVNSRSLADVLPGLKVFSDVELNPGTLGVSVFDLTRRQELFTQDLVDPRKQPLDWPRLRPALLEANPNKIDVHELTDREQNAQFFVEEVRKRIAAEPAPAALIILSGPMEFTHDVDVHPIELASHSAGKIFYFRYHPLPVRAPIVVASQAYQGRRRGISQSQPGFAVQEPIDALEPLLKPLQPRVFDVYDPAQFRKALAEVIKEIGQM